MRSRSALWALLACAWAAGPGPSAAQASLRYTLALDGLAESAQRLELRAPGWRLLALGYGRGGGLAPDRLDFGLECPWGAAGPLAPRGLLRALADPLGYSPASEVFSEPTGFRLEGAFRDSAGRRGLWLEPFPGSLGLFLLRQPEARGPEAGSPGGQGLVQAGGALRLRRSGMEAGALALLSLPSGTGPPPEDWQCEDPPFPGGALLHLGGSLQAGTPHLACRLLAAASGGPRVAPGLLGLLRLKAQGGAWGVTGLLGAGSRDYRLPDGGRYPGDWTAGLGLEAQPLPGLRFAGSWRRRVDRPPPVPAGFLPGSEEGELAARWSLPLAAGGLLEAKTAASARARYGADGQTERSAAGELELALRGKAGRLDLSLRGDWRKEGLGLRGQLCGERGGLRLQAGAAGSPGSLPARTGLRWHPFGRLEASGRDWLFWLSLGAGEEGRGLSLGWSAAQPLGKSPTVRTSRCRR
jgi:hypothetical protein